MGKKDTAPKNSKREHRESNAVEEYDPNSTKSQANLIMGISALCIVGVVLCLGVFFTQSDILAERIASANKSSDDSHVSDSPPEPNSSDGSDNVGTVGDCDGISSNGDSDIETNTNTNTNTDCSSSDTSTDEPSDTDSSDSSDQNTGNESTANGSTDTGSGTTNNDSETDIPGVVDNKDLVEHLDKMDDEEFKAFADKLINAKGEAALGDGKTLADAYAEAEAKYPGKIDGSQRLKLIQELNAIDYMYYVAEHGDTLFDLSQTFNTGLGQLIEINGIHNADKIKAGQIILFPKETVQPDNQHEPQTLEIKEDSAD